MDMGTTSQLKTHEHSRRSSNNCPNVKVQTQMKVTFNQHAFMSNDLKKTEFITDNTKTNSRWMYVKQSKDDSDTMNVSAALDNALNGNTVTVFANDTDIILI